MAKIPIDPVWPSAIVRANFEPMNSQTVNLNFAPNDSAMPLFFEWLRGVAIESVLGGGRCKP
jgi:hypothetical protein